MNITELVDSACRCLKDQCFTDLTIYSNYRWYWNGLLKSIDSAAEFSFQIRNSGQSVLVYWGCV